EDERITRHNWPAKARLFNSRKQHKLLISIFNFTQRQDGTDLGQRFNNQNSGHHGCARKVALKKWFIDAHLLNAHDALARHKFDDAIDKQEGKAMRKEFLYCLGIKDCFHWPEAIERLPIDDCQL